MNSKMTASPIPLPLFLSLVSAAESILLLFVFPHALPEATLKSLFLIFALLNFGVFAVWRVFIYPFFVNPLRHLPGPKGISKGEYPLIGHGFTMFSRPPGGHLLRFMKEVQNDGLIHFRGFFNADRLVLTDPRALADVLVHNSYDFEKPPWVREFLRQFLGDGLLMTEGEEHKFQRKHIMPAFSFRHIKELYPIFWQKSFELTQAIAAEIYENPEAPASEKGGVPSSVVEINHWANKATMDIIGLAGLGRDIQALKNSDDELIKNYEEILEPTAEKGIYFVCNLLFPQRILRALPWKINERVRITSNNLKAICRQFVQEKKQRMKTQSEDQKDILSVLIESNDFSDDSLVDQLLTFLAAGHETTSSAFTWITHLLATHPDIQNTLREEVFSNLPSPSASAVSGEDISALLESLPYLNGVCTETLRLFPTIPVSSRISIRPTTISGVPIPAGIQSIIAPWAINRSPTLWGPDSEVFRPERWIDYSISPPGINGSGGANSNYAFSTFIQGPRSCIGERFARAELRALVAVFVGKYEMEMANPNEVVKPAGTITLKPKNGMRLRLRAVDGEW
ncbi:cytochrome P450 [Mytilinidion resinicola]|uniref:Cytochrome P450 n=1 Tax=Mytilinidion resinicola TaxID=574789 RepID=A0A6A6YN96_9PEZI|nr:cytochrome P450 [Mytilinidion resinicola]KAF2810260.1 cytochrome P450 [Mytilinidion resinicola]